MEAFEESKKSSVKKYLPYIVILGALAAFYYFRYRKPAEIAFGQMQVTALDGTSHLLSEYLSEKNVVHFYASWCGPCIREMGEINKQWASISDENIRFIFLTDDEISRIEPFRSQMPEDAIFLQIHSLKETGVYTIPTTYFLQNGDVKSSQVDAVDWTKKEDIKKRFN
jgi:thiol-disulfide isomerase/thioredoxin